MTEEGRIRQIVDGRVVAVRRQLYTVTLLTVVFAPAGDGAILTVQATNRAASPGPILELRLDRHTLSDEERLRSALQEAVRQRVTADSRG